MSGPAGASGPLVLRVGDLLATPGRRRSVGGTYVVDGMTVGAGGIVEDVVELHLVLECQAGRIMVSGTVEACWELECRRCLGPVRVPVVPRLTEVFEVSPAEGETFPLVGEQVDLVPMLAQTVLLTLPLAPLCDETCQGPVEGAHYGSAREGEDDDGDGPSRPQRDPRWAALDDFRPVESGGT